MKVKLSSNLPGSWVLLPLLLSLPPQGWDWMCVPRCPGCYICVNALMSLDLFSTSLILTSACMNTFQPFSHMKVHLLLSLESKLHEINPPISFVPVVNPVTRRTPVTQQMLRKHLLANNCALYSWKSYLPFCSLCAQCGGLFLPVSDFSSPI